MGLLFWLCFLKAASLPNLLSPIFCVKRMKWGGRMPGCQGWRWALAHSSLSLSSPRAPDCLSLKYLSAPRRLKAKGSEPASCLSCEMAGLMCYLSSQQAPRSTPLSASRVRPHRPLPFLPTLWSLRGPWCRPFQDGDKTPLHLSSWVHRSGSEGALQGRFLTLVLLPFP